ncbi:MAG: hypothetical protein R3F61_35270, partial [Myxococcota bacterium]
HPEDPAAAGSILESLPKDAPTPADRLRTLDHLAKGGALELAGFRAWRWTPDAEGARAAKLALTDRIRLTKYLIYESAGSPERTDTFDTALYAAPTGEEARQLTRQAVFAGAYEPGGAHAGEARPLVWMSRRDVNRAILQGSVQVRFADGTSRMLNVHVSNDVPYDRTIRDPNLQGRYWYFREVEGFRGYGDTDKIRLEPGVTVAGDVFGLGLGTVLLVSDGTVGRVVVLADTGGAFQPNLYQLDWFAGVFPDHAAYEAGTAHLPTKAEAWVLVAR